MADNFDMKKFLVENKLGAYSRMKNEGEAAYEYEKGKEAGEKIEKEKLAKEDYAGAEEEKMMDFLAEEPDQAKVQDIYDKITAVIAKAAKKLSDDDASALHDKLKAFFNKLFEEKEEIKETVDNRTLMAVEKLQDMLSNLISNTSTNSNIPTADKQGLLGAFQEMEDLLENIGADIEIEMDDRYVSDYSKYRQKLK